MIIVIIVIIVTIITGALLVRPVGYACYLCDCRNFNDTFACEHFACRQQMQTLCIL